jgi:hypothetical protein
MCLEIGGFYNGHISQAQATLEADRIGLAPFAGKIAALEAALAAGPAGNTIVPTIAGGLVRAMAQLVINDFEDHS